MKCQQTLVTGENLYNELKEHLLGEPEQRNLVKSYEEKLSQYFFDNETVSLIPKHNQDVVNIKIGEDKQRPIYELGDGLQQAIILTYETYIKKTFRKYEIDSDGHKSELKRANEILRKAAAFFAQAELDRPHK